MTTGEGGMITTDDDDLAERIRLYSLHGMSRDAWKRYTSQGSWYYEILYPGFKYNMTDIQAALGIHQLSKLDSFIDRRAAIAHQYNHAFANCSSFFIPREDSQHRHAWHLYPLLLNLDELRINRDEFIERLKEEKIGTSVHFIPNHLQPYYRNTFGYKEGDFPNAEWVYSREISLPMYPKMTKNEVQRVIEATLKICDKYKTAQVGEPI